MIKVSDTICLRRVSLSDVYDIFNTIDGERIYLRKWLPFVDKTLKESDIFTYVQSVIEHDEKQYCILEKGKFVGIVGFKDPDLNSKKTEIGYWLSINAQGKGIMIQSVKRLLSYAFDESGLNRVQIKVAVENKKSRAIPEKLGFTLEGIERDGELLVDNKYTDLIIYSLLKKEFVL